MVVRLQERTLKRFDNFFKQTYMFLCSKVLKEQCSVNIDKDGGDIAFITYEKGEAEAKVILE